MPDLVSVASEKPEAWPAGGFRTDTRKRGGKSTNQLKVQRCTVLRQAGGRLYRKNAEAILIEFAGSMLSTLSRRVMARGLRPSPLALHRVRMCQSAAAQPEVKVTIEEPTAAVSDDETAEVALEKALRPKEIVEQLDRYIIGQPEAKRAVAVAMRNRWRRQRVASPLKEEVCRHAPSKPAAPRAVSPHALRLPAMRACAHPDGARAC